MRTTRIPAGRLLAIMMLIFLLAACGGAANTVTGGGDIAAVVDEIDVASLPVNIDVQTTAALQSRPDVLLIDVREDWEYDEGHIPGISHLPMGEVAGRLSEIPTDQMVIITCRSGNRSGQVTDFLRDQGYTNVHNMDGGILAWQEAGFAVE